MRSVFCLTTVAVALLPGCLYKSGGKYVGTLGVAQMSILPAELTTADDVSVSLTIHFVGTTTSAAPTAKVRITLDDGEPRTVTVSLTPEARKSGPGFAVGTATVQLGKLSAGEHAIVAVVAAPPGLAGAVQPPLLQKVTVK